MSIKGASIKILEHANSIEVNQELSSVKISNINDINILLDVLQRVKDKYYTERFKNITDLSKEICDL